MAIPTASSMLARSISVRFESLGIVELPSFLCPALLRPTTISRTRSLYAQGTLRSVSISPQRRFLTNEVYPRPCKYEHTTPSSFARLPQQCGGCGALSQTIDESDPGFYSLSRRSVKEYMGNAAGIKGAQKTLEDKILEATMQNVEDGVIEGLQFDLPISPSKPVPTPVCDRCHKLIHHQTGVSIQHPSIGSIQDTIMESPHKYNHVYHVVDAADFPMSFIPNLQTLLHLTPQRSLNRRSKVGRFYHGKKTEVSFIITRSDLLAPLKTQIDSLMPYLVSVLRDALGSIGQDVRLGNVRCVSAKRGWWTKELKEDIWNRGGGGWMVGKVNVGKSQLFESVFPKGRRGIVKVGHSLSGDAKLDKDKDSIGVEDHMATAHTGQLDPFSLLPPAQPETDFPEMPLVSSLPGTTASPIRVPFGNGKGELVDLPGLSRGDLELHIQEAYRPSIIMKSRIEPEQQVIKPGQSLLIGGFIRITPTTPDTIFMGYSFTPMESHLTSTEKAIGIQTQELVTGTLNIAVPGTGEKILSAGKFPLKWDVTKQRSGPVTERSAAGIKVDRLPWRVFSTDILIEGCGWVEIVAQVRVKSLSTASYTPFSGAQGSEGSSPEPEWPEVEVFSPKGKFIGSRRPIGAWLMAKAKKPVRATKSRPRKSMKGVKQREKAMKRLAET